MRGITPLAIASLCFVLLTSQRADADCWMQCIAHNPFNGNCIEEIKMCNASGAGDAVENVKKDLQKAVKKIEDEWKNTYGHLPEELRMVLDNYPLTVLSLVIPGTAPYRMMLIAYETLVVRSKGRSQKAKVVMDRSPEWKDALINKGLAFITIMDGDSIANFDWKEHAEQYVTPALEVPWDEFLACIDAAPDLTTGNVCLKTFRMEVFTRT